MVFVLRITTPSGIRTSVHTTQPNAMEAVFRYANKWWGRGGNFALESKRSAKLAKPVDHGALVEHYFELAKGESYEIEECGITGADANWCYEQGDKEAAAMVSSMLDRTVTPEEVRFLQRPLNEAEITTLVHKTADDFLRKANSEARDGLARRLRMYNRVLGARAVGTEIYLVNAIFPAVNVFIFEAFTERGSAEERCDLAGVPHTCIVALMLHRSNPVEAALEIVERFGDCAGETHHQAWLIDQMVRALTGDEYASWVAEHKAGDEGPNSYSWNEGVAP